MDLYLNCWALHIYDTHRAVSASDLVAAAGPDATGSGELAAGWAALGGLAGRWRIAVAEGVVQLAQRWRDGTYTNKPQVCACACIWRVRQRRQRGAAVAPSHASRGLRCSLVVRVCVGGGVLVCGCFGG